jgi:hypothetical protein
MNHVTPVNNDSILIEIWRLEWVRGQINHLELVLLNKSKKSCIYYLSKHVLDFANTHKHLK